MDRTDDRKFYWVVLTPSTFETVAYLESDTISSVASTIASKSFLAVLVVNSQWSPERAVAAYIVQSRTSEGLETCHPIYPSALESREPITPPPSFAAFGDCVLNTSRRAIFCGVYNGPLESGNLITPECLGSFPTQRWTDMDREFKQRDEKNKEEKRREQAEAGYVPGADDDDVWTNFSVKSTEAALQPHEFYPLVDIQVVVSFDLSAVRELVPASEFFEEDLKIKRFRANYSREGAERIFSWVQEQSAHACLAILENSVEDLSHPVLVALASSLENPYDLAEESSSNSQVDDDEWECEECWDRPATKRIWFPCLQNIDPHCFSVIYFDVFGTLIDNETGIWDALQPLLERSRKDLSRFEALSLYFDVEEEVKERGSSDAPLLRQCYEAFALRLGLTWTYSESSTFAASIASWPLFPGTVAYLQQLRPHVSFIARVDIDALSLSLCTTFTLLRSYFDEIRVPGPDAQSPRCRMDFDAADLPIMQHGDKSQVPHTNRCVVSSSLPWGIEPARRADVPGVWLRLPGSLTSRIPGYSQSFTPWRICDGFDNLVSVLQEPKPPELSPTDSGIFMLR